MSAKENLRRRHLLFGLPTARVGLSSQRSDRVAELITASDANLFKEAFIKAQQDNEKLFGKE